LINQLPFEQLCSQAETTINISIWILWFLWCYLSYTKAQSKTRNMGQSPMWGHLAP